MFSATAIANFLACPHTATLERAEARGEIKRPFFDDPAIEVVRKLGFEHEKRYVQELQTGNGRLVIEIELNGSWQEAARRTVEAMRRGTDVVYQGTFLDEPWRGRADFLVKVASASDLGPWSYEPVDTKLARSTKAGALIQLCFYSDLLTSIQGVEPRRMRVVLGGGVQSEEFAVQRYIAYYRRAKADYRKAYDDETATYPDPVEHCDVCAWYHVCDKQWRDDDHLSLVAGISRIQRKALAEHGIRTVADLGKLTVPPRPNIERIGDAALVRIREQARIQVQGREEGQLCYELLQVDAGQGLTILPAPSPGDLFLDFEGNPYVLDQGGLEYLIGIVTPSNGAGEEARYEGIWGFNRSEEKRAFETFMAKVMARWRDYPDMHIYHYAPYEPTAIKRLAGRHSVCIDEVDQLLRAGVFVDLYKAVRQGIRASVESYSIKRLEPLYAFNREVKLRDANVALALLEAALALGNSLDEIQPVLQTIEGYNQDDCFSTLRLRDWLEQRRVELESAAGQSLPRPVPQSGEPPEQLGERLQRTRALMARLMDGAPEDQQRWNDEQRARWLLAQLLEWHRREDKSAWWEYYRLRDLSDEALQEDSNALGGLVYIGEADRVDRSIIHQYGFPPQDHSLGRALEVRDPATGKTVDVERIDDLNRTINIRRGVRSKAPHPRALIPFCIIKGDVLPNSLLRLGEWVADNGIAGSGAFQSARDLLLRRPPPALTTPMECLIGDNERLTRPATQLVTDLPLRASVLPIQGPPGSGKTYTGARMIVELVTQGKRVGITAVSHKVITNLLCAVCEYAKKLGVQIRAVQKSKHGDECRDPGVEQVDNEGIYDALAGGCVQIAAGSAWLWARPEMAASVDVLLVDEASQMALANVLGICQAATSLVLLGDPQQLEQPQRGVHPAGAEVSALGHLLNGQATIRADQGIFLAETRRLHPDICEFTSELFYDGRLVARPENANQRLNTEGPIDGTGLRFFPVTHSGNQNESPEEVAVVAKIVDELLRNGTTWTDKDRGTFPLTLQDVLVVAPYNAHVAALRARLAPGTRIGTVDKFQGQEAPVVIYTMATSTLEDAPRGMQFLYNLNRLNVATSRARCVTIIIANPALLKVQCKHPRQIELANALCRYVEMSRSTEENL